MADVQPPPRTSSALANREIETDKETTSRPATTHFPPKPTHTLSTDTADNIPLGVVAANLQHTPIPQHHIPANGPTARLLASDSPTSPMIPIPVLAQAEGHIADAEFDPTTGEAISDPVVPIILDDYSSSRSGSLMGEIPSMEGLEPDVGRSDGTGSGSGTGVVVHDVDHHTALGESDVRRDEGSEERARRLAREAILGSLEASSHSTTHLPQTAKTGSNTDAAAQNKDGESKSLLTTIRDDAAIAVSAIKATAASALPRKKEGLEEEKPQKEGENKSLLNTIRDDAAIAVTAIKATAASALPHKKEGSEEKSLPSSADAPSSTAHASGTTAASPGPLSQNTSSGGAATRTAQPGEIPRSSIAKSQDTTNDKTDINETPTSDLEGVRTAPGVHESEKELKTVASGTPWAFARSAALKEKFQGLESPITDIPGTPENPKRDEHYLSGTFRSCERSQAELEKHVLPKLAQFLMTSDPFVNVGFVTVFGIVGWCIGNWNWSWLWALFLGVGYALYTLRIRSTMQKAVDFELRRNEAVLRLGENVESAEWLNFFIAQLWPIIDPALFTAAIDTLEDQFVAQAPTFITRIHIADFELGPRAPRITSMQVYPKASGEDAVLMDLTVAFQPSPQEIASQTRLNMHILINIHVGHPKLGSVAVPIMAEAAGFEAKIRIWLKMSSKAPFVKTLKFTLLNKPSINFAVKPLKMGNIMNLPVLSQFIMGTIDKTIEDMLVTPKLMSLELDRILLGDAALGDTRALGIIKIVFRQARNLRAADWSGSSDPYATISFGNSTNFLARTRILPRDRNPLWNETHYAIVTEDDVKNGVGLSVKVWDFDALTRNEVLGMFEVRVEEIVDSEGVIFDGWKSLLKKNEAKDGGAETLARNGKLNFQLGFYPKVDLKDNHEAAQRYKSGILSLQLHQALDLILRPKDKDGLYPSPYIHVYCNDLPCFKTRVKHNNPSPVWAATTEFFIRDWSRTVLRLVVKDARQHEHDPVLGVVVLKLGEVFGKTEEMMVSNWHELQGGIAFGRVRCSVAFRSVKLEEPENMRGFPVGDLVVNDVQLRGLETMVKGESKPPHVRIRIRSPLTEPTSLSTKTAQPASFTPTWCTTPASPTGPDAKLTLDKTPATPSDPLTLHLTSRYQTALRFEVVAKSGPLSLRSRVLAVGKMFAQDMVDDQPRKVTLLLKRWKGKRKDRKDAGKDSEGEDHLETTDKDVLLKEKREKRERKRHLSLKKREVENKQSAPHLEDGEIAKVDEEKREALDETESLGSSPATPTPSIRVSESNPSLAQTQTDSDASDSDDAYSDYSDAEFSDTASVASDFSDVESDDGVDEAESFPVESNEKLGAPTTGPHSSRASTSTTSAKPELTFTAVFRPGKTWTPTPREGEEIEQHVLAQSSPSSASSQRSHTLHPDTTNPQLFTTEALTSAPPSPSSKKDKKKAKDANGADLGGSPADDSRLAGSKLSRTLEWSKDTVLEGVKSTKLWKRGSKKSLVGGQGEF
ncbi:uncharacterized protein EV422DRAFT_546542 [Fimicolochytrium jonesii]|uniref:uncharacterized protein n=1 Tax=Fimicolochytrium jonesii TaxID=1396493 RepID=UPI0022FDB326|nr:uncharacterized protein EV422DRAFT_546542 [Fimicolochytrium jonesii]KAI8816213.1 hypothetical protein EV422DRAFT_546542 [Fimicolochytrium jonesii]